MQEKPKVTISLDSIAVLRQKQPCGRGLEVDLNLLRLEVANNNFHLCLNLEIYFKYFKGIATN
jgi:hypothetical protein